MKDVSEHNEQLAKQVDELMERTAPVGEDTPYQWASRILDSDFDNEVKIVAMSGLFFGVALQAGTMRLMEAAMMLAHYHNVAVAKATTAKDEPTGDGADKYGM